MIRYSSSAHSSVIELEVDGTISNPELEDVFERLRIDIEQHGKTRLLEIIHDFHGIEPAAIWTDLRRGLPMMHKVGRVAVVADQKWIRAMTGLAHLFTSAEIMAFAPGEVLQARAWLEEG